MSEPLRTRGQRVLRVLGWLGLALALALAGLESFCNGASSPIDEDRVNDRDVPLAVCRELQREFAAQQAHGCALLSAAREKLLAHSREDPRGYVERFRWRCEQGGRLHGYRRSGIDWTGLCLRCEVAVDDLACPL